MGTERRKVREKSSGGKKLHEFFSLKAAKCQENKTKQNLQMLPIRPGALCPSRRALKLESVY